MRIDSLDLPWHRVITASGRPAKHLTTRQLELLRAEGVLSNDGKIPLDEVRYAFPELDGSARLEDQPHQCGGAGQAREGGGRRTRVQRVHREPEHQRAQQHLRPFR